MPLQKVRFIGRYGNFRVGEVITPASATFRDQLLKLKVAELVIERKGAASVTRTAPVPAAPVPAAPVVKPEPAKNPTPQAAANSRNWSRR